MYLLVVYLPPYYMEAPYHGKSAPFHVPDSETCQTDIEIILDGQCLFPRLTFWGKNVYKMSQYSLSVSVLMERQYNVSLPD
jgi:hypothetical protein